MPPLISLPSITILSTRKCPLRRHILAPPEGLRAPNLPWVNPGANPGSQGVIPRWFKWKKIVTDGRTDRRVSWNSYLDYSFFCLHLSNSKILVGDVWRGKNFHLGRTSKGPSTSLFRPTRLSVHPPSSVRHAFVTKNFFRLNRLGITPWLLGSIPGVDPG